MAYKPFGPQDQLQITSLGMEFALTEIIGAAAGYWLDKKFGTLPWCFLGGVLAGFALGMTFIVQAAKQISKNGKKKN